MKYKADKIKFLTHHMKFVIFLVIVDYLFGHQAGQWLYAVYIFYICKDILNDKKSGILPSFEISDSEIWTDKFSRIKLSEIDLEKSTISKREIVLINKVDTWKNKVRIYPKMFNEDIADIISTKLSLSETTQSIPANHLVI
ncbi:MAG: hypothetical protein MK132_26345 [Lentisphaerales bacterium]|nr:hypothetical protein [Lentisphaerales bacterium]